MTAAHAPKIAAVKPSHPPAPVYPGINSVMRRAAVRFNVTNTRKKLAVDRFTCETKMGRLFWTSESE